MAQTQVGENADMTQTQGSGADKDDLLKVLSDPVNRAIVSYFNDSPSNTATFSDLSAHLDENLPGEREASVLLHHKCLPELSYFGLIEYDAGRDTVESLRPEVLESLQEYVDHWI